MKKSDIQKAVIVFTAFVVVLLASIFTIEQRQFAIVFQFGEIIRSVKEPGLHFKVPFVQNVLFFDNRILNSEVESMEVTASDEKRIIVTAFAKYQILNPVEFYKTVNNTHNVKVYINRILDSSIRRVIGTKPLISLLSNERTEIMNRINENVNLEAKRYGINVLDVRIVRADLPQENSKAIASRMMADRQKEAKQFRAEGFEAASRIKASADREAKVILADSRKNAEITRGIGDAEATKIYNNIYSRDPEFYRFYRSLKTYKNTFNAEDTSFIISPDSEFLKFLKLTK